MQKEIDGLRALLQEKANLLELANARNRDLERKAGLRDGPVVNLVDGCFTYKSGSCDFWDGAVGPSRCVLKARGEKCPGPAAEGYEYRLVQAQKGSQRKG